MVLYIHKEGGARDMAKKKKKNKHKLEKVAIIVSILQGIATIICVIYETFFK